MSQVLQSLLGSSEGILPYPQQEECGEERRGGELLNISDDWVSSSAWSGAGFQMFQGQAEAGQQSIHVFTAPWHSLLLSPGPKPSAPSAC